MAHVFNLWKSLRVKRITLALAAAASTTACYTLMTATTVMSNAPAWTGTGSRVIGNIDAALGLAGQDVHTFDVNGARVAVAPFLAQFGGPYQLTGYVQTATLDQHQVEFAHGNPVGRTDNLRLLYKSHPANRATWVEPFWPAFWERDEYFQVVQICGLAASEAWDAVHPDAPTSHLFLSVRACGQTSGVCHGGVVEAAFDGPTARWWVRSNQQGYQATLRKPDGTRYSNECMPISVTSGLQQERQYLVVGDPSWDEVAVFDALRLWSGALSSWRTPDPSRVIRDVVAEGRREETFDMAFAAVLWSSGSGTEVRHHGIVNGSADAVPFLTEPLPADVRFIESTSPRVLGDTADLYTFGTQVVRRRYTR